jgi:hypothetical protein
MKCLTCDNWFDEDATSLVCPHRKLEPQGTPLGGIRILTEQYALVNTAYHEQDANALFRLMGHGNPAVRLYATQMYKALEDTTHF